MRRGLLIVSGGNARHLAQELIFRELVFTGRFHIRSHCTSVTHDIAKKGVWNVHMILKISFESESSPASIAALFARNISRERSCRTSVIWMMRRTRRTGDLSITQRRSQEGPRCLRNGAICRRGIISGEVAVTLRTCVHATSATSSIKGVDGMIRTRSTLRHLHMRLKRPRSVGRMSTRCLPGRSTLGRHGSSRLERLCLCSRNVLAHEQRWPV